MPTVWATYVVFEEERLIAESIRSVKAYVDGYVFVDAAFTTNPVEATHSRDRTREVAERAAHPLPVRYHESERRLGLDEARNLSHAMVPAGAWMLIMDGDETLLGPHADVSWLLDSIRAGKAFTPIGVSVYTLALLFSGHAPAISEEAYGALPVVASRGVQARLLPVDGTDWRRAPDGRTWGLYRNGQLVKAPPPTTAFEIVNQRTRQTFEAYQADYVREMADTPHGPRGQG